MKKYPFKSLPLWFQKLCTNKLSCIIVDSQDIKALGDG